MDQSWTYRYLKVKFCSPLPTICQLPLPINNDHTLTGLKILQYESKNKVCVSISVISLLDLALNLCYAGFTSNPNWLQSPVVEL
jgi:hypothetical protein